MSIVNHSSDFKKTEQAEKIRFRGKIQFLRELNQYIRTLKQNLTEYGLHYNDQTAILIYQIGTELKESAPFFGYEQFAEMAEQLIQMWSWAKEAGKEPPADFYRQTKTILNEMAEECEVQLRELENTRKEQGAYEGSAIQRGRILLMECHGFFSSSLIRRLESDGYEIDAVEDVESAKEMCRERKYDLIALDLFSRPGYGYPLLEYLRDNQLTKWLPLIVLTDAEYHNEKVRCLQMGADDFITKPFHYEEVEARIRQLILRSKHYEEMASIDPLTGLYNRRFFKRQLLIEMDRSKRSNTPVSVGFLDIDRFKQLNDTYGHAVGDQVLQGFAHLLQSSIKSTDVLARFGGEEFVILFPQKTKTEAAELLEEILQRMRAEPIVQVEGQDFFITFSAGVAQYDEKMTADGWLHLADESMYLAKQKGRNRIMICSRTEDTEEASSTLFTPVKRVLIADDDKFIRSILKSRLSALKLKLFEAKDGEETLHLLQTIPIDLCILDGIMPKLDGFMVLEKMKQNPQLATTRVLMLSGRNKEDDVVRGLLLGADDYMSKPFSLVELEIRVKRLLNLN
ncbi:diguanylate cyclase [Brevibacillus fulvus]|uniref:Diguanylate cyclase (GGDEF)-like protein n=1 Tax=Brevibacillus fulvus TaxID=1125967 RepID=A0A938XXD9_9BACL|nr:diguanylate cyclase [Brevibacillus fulvus]MBM7589445.1 diguanylate cyclase (GGDEF)-like protein [Brevibacillus fulvus]